MPCFDRLRGLSFVSVAAVKTVFEHAECMGKSKAHCTWFATMPYHAQRRLAKMQSKTCSLCVLCTITHPAALHPNRKPGAGSTMDPYWPNKNAKYCATFEPVFAPPSMGHDPGPITFDTTHHAPNSKYVGMHITPHRHLTCRFTLTDLESFACPHRRTNP